MDGDALLTTGGLARRTGPTVKTIRFHADSGIVPPTDRSPAGRAGTGPCRSGAARRARPRPWTWTATG
ncbi:hypothetical protein GCM10023235_53250 [Kitasatospora terrestris]|uniref:HTH merR-type domain-containing protein n=1 Tax=Kitasatospora terrestris TaxID=258051 RepID=A0ABP9E4L7_9ACTN